MYSHTKVTFMHSTEPVVSQVRRVLPFDANHLAVVVDCTSFHPVSPIWSDHPADRGTLTVNGQSYDVTQCLMGVIEQQSGLLYIGSAIPVKRETSGWAWVVVHVIDTCAQLQEHDQVSLTVDADYQYSLSCGHSAGHLAYLALNKVLTTQGYWRKAAERKDPHGNYDFNSYAQQTSQITPYCCMDTYRLGKTLRKRGLNQDDMLQNLSFIEQQVNEQLIAWLALERPIQLLYEGDALIDSRYWVCDLDEAQPVKIACGGTHVTKLSVYQSIQVRLTQQDQHTVIMQTQAQIH